jgi:tripartite-type tricarboxylate transporter receptor subunit TctC
MVVPFPAGGGSDIVARVLAQRLTATLGQTMVADNRAGASGNIAAEIAAKAPADGYTLLFANSSLSISPAAYTKLSFDPVKDFAPISMVSSYPFVLVSHPSLPVKNVRELIDLAKAAPGHYQYASTGTGTPNHLGMVLLLVNANINMLHVPYRSSGQITIDLISGQVQSAFSGVPQIMPHVKTGRLRAIGVGHPQRLNALPEVQTIAEVVPGFNNSGYYGLLAPPQTPRVLIERLNAELKKAFNAPDMVKRLESNGLVTATGTPQQFGELIGKDLVLWRKVIKTAGVTPD